MLLNVLADTRSRTDVGSLATRDSVLRARLTDPSNTGLRPPRTPTSTCVRAHAGTALPGLPFGR
jgi:hypothetical protein